MDRAPESWTYRSRGKLSYYFCRTWSAPCCIWTPGSGTSQEVKVYARQKNFVMACTIPLTRDTSQLERNAQGLYSSSFKLSPTLPITKYLSYIRHLAVTLSCRPHKMLLKDNIASVRSIFLRGGKVTLQMTSVKFKWEVSPCISSSLNVCLFQIKKKSGSSPPPQLFSLKWRPK